jgi:hypothetical protein
LKLLLVALAAVVAVLFAAPAGADIQYVQGRPAFGQWQSYWYGARTFNRVYHQALPQRQ